jgi:hypothetical protein
VKISAMRVLRIVIVAAIFVELLYLGDWWAFRVRVSHGTAYGSVDVHQFLATSLKGNKTEYDMTGTVQKTCSHSIFPQKGNPACWWLERHKSQWEQ